MNNQLDQNNRLQSLENRLLKVEAENTNLKNLFNSLFSGSNETRLYFKRQVVFDKQAIIGFYGKDAVKQQTLASDTLANLLTALRILGIIG